MSACYVSACKKGKGDGRGNRLAVVHISRETKGKRLLDKGSPDSQKKVDRVLEIQEWERRKREGKVLRVLLLEYAKELGIDSLSNTC